MFIRKHRLRKAWLGLFLSFFLSLPLHANVLHASVSINSPDLEKVIQQLDWDMTRLGQQGRQARNQAVTKLTCIGQQGENAKYRVLQTAGRLWGHENELVQDAAWQIFKNLSAELDSDRFTQRFLLRSRHLQHYDDLMEVLEYLVTNKKEGLEIIHELYPTMQEAARLNQLADLFFQHTGRILKIRLRVFNVKAPTTMEWTTIHSIMGEVIQDFHLDQVDTDFICP